MEKKNDNRDQLADVEIFKSLTTKSRFQAEVCPKKANPPNEGNFIP